MIHVEADAAQAFPRDVRNRPESGLKRLAAFIARLRHLRENERTLSALFPVIFQHGLPGRAASGEKIENDVTLVRECQTPLDQFKRLGVIERLEPKQRGQCARAVRRDVEPNIIQQRRVRRRNVMLRLAVFREPQQRDFPVLREKPPVNLVLRDALLVCIEVAQHAPVMFNRREAARLAPAPLPAIRRDAEQFVAHRRAIRAAPMIIPRPRFPLAERLFLAAEADVRAFRVHQRVFIAAAKPVNRLELTLHVFRAAPDDNRVAIILLAENFIHQQAQIRGLVIVNRDENQAIFAQQIAGEIEARIHHRKPDRMKMPVFAAVFPPHILPARRAALVGQSGAARIIGLTLAEIIGIDEAVAAGVIRRIKVNQPDFAEIRGLQQAQRVEVLPFQQDVRGRVEIHAAGAVWHQADGGGFLDFAAGVRFARPGQFIAFRAHSACLPTMSYDEVISTALPNIAQAGQYFTRANSIARSTSFGLMPSP